MTTDWHHDIRVGPGARIRAARAYAGLTRRELVERVEDPGLTQQVLAAYESGDRWATEPHLEAIAKACVVPLTFLIDGFGAAQSGLQRAASTGFEQRDAVEMLMAGRVVQAAATLEQVLVDRITKHVAQDQQTLDWSSESPSQRISLSSLDTTVDQLRASGLAPETIDRIKEVFAKRSSVIHGGFGHANSESATSSVVPDSNRAIQLEELARECEDLTWLTAPKPHLTDDEVTATLADLVAAARATTLESISDSALRRQLARLRSLDSGAVQRALSRARKP